MAGVLFDNRSALIPRTTGWERYTRELCRRLPAEVDVAFATSRGVSGSLLADWFSLPVRGSSYSLTHFPTFPPTPAFKGPFIWTVHDLTWWRSPELASRGGRLYYRHLAQAAIHRGYVLTVSQAIAKEVIETFDIDPSRIHTAHLGLSELPDVSPATLRNPYILTVGSMEPRKNLARLIEAYHRSGLAGSVDLVICGRVAWQRANFEGVTVISDADDARLSALYRGALSFILPSVYEGFGLPLLEAMATGTRVYCSDIPVFREVAGEDAYYFDPHDTDSIAEALQAAVGHEAFDDLSQQLISRAQSFTWDACAEATIEIYRSVSD